MSHATTFRLSQATFRFEDGPPVQVDFVADQKSSAKNTHFTLLMGANGTCKSRILSCCVNLLRTIHEKERGESLQIVRRPTRSEEPDRSMRCDFANLMRDGVLSTFGQGSLFESGTVLPSRVLAVANLVRDRFTFVDRDESISSFYYYLGVRQATNLTTTGAMDRLVSDAVLHLLSDADKYSSFSKWAQRLFPDCEMGLMFPRFSMESIHRFLEDPNKWVESRMGNAQARSYILSRVKQINPQIKNLRKLIHLIDEYGNRLDCVDSSNMKRGGSVVLCLDQLSLTIRHELGQLSAALTLAASIGLLSRPSLVVKSQKWLDFMQLSSGEQNLLSTGARLLAFAVPGSLIVIDEPEVSLNVAWQQRYVELISEALVDAKGSHVIIASHSPYLVSDLRLHTSTVVVAERTQNELAFRSVPGTFWGWGCEAILYEVLGVPSASNYHFSRELASILKLVKDKVGTKSAFESFLTKCDQIEFDSSLEPLKLVIEEIRAYSEGL